ncbi:MAG: hypothetical protein WAK67_20005 [Xanthobacteraceae bacterium]
MKFRTQMRVRPIQKSRKLERDAAVQEVSTGESEQVEHSVEEDTWQPLPIDRDNVAYQEAIGAAEQATEIIEGNNGYAQAEPEERNAIVESIKGSLKAIREGTPSLSAIKAGLLAPLQYLSKKLLMQRLAWRLMSRSKNCLHGSPNYFELPMPLHTRSYGLTHGCASHFFPGLNYSVAAVMRVD